MEGNTKITLRIPPQDLREFTLFALNAHAADEWSQALPVTNTQDVVKLISQALADLNRVSLAPELRYEILETLIPNLNIAVANLSKRFLNQPLIMPAGPQKMAELAGDLHSMASTAYTIVAIETIQQNETVRDINPALLTCLALQRALSYAGRMVLQTYQLFRPLEIHGWRALHQLYALAEKQKLAELPLPEPREGASTIHATYLQALLLGCCKPNHLRQSDLTALYHALPDWSTRVELQSTEGSDGLFLVDLHSDQPPLYRSLYKTDPGSQCRIIDTTKLISYLHKLRPAAGVEKVKVSENVSLPVAMLDHLVSSLGKMSLRNFKRTPSNSELRVCLGLRTVHYHVGDERSFEQILHGSSYVSDGSVEGGGNPFLRPANEGDIWQKANPHEYYADDPDHVRITGNADGSIDMPSADRALVDDEAPEPDPVDQHSVYTVQMSDLSPGGYCLQWNEDMPTDIRSGDIVGLKEQNGKEWSIAVIRWFGQFDDAKTLIGLELLSPRAMSFGASIHQKNGQKTPPMRVLLLPEIRLVGQPHTIITPRAGFKERQKITLGNSTEEASIQLSRQVSATGSFAQFEYEYVKSLGDLLSSDDDVKLGADYDSLWSNI